MSIRMNMKQVVAVAGAALAVSIAAQNTSARVDFGKEGEAVDLVIGYQPYYTESWSGVVNNGKGFWKKYLPEGSTARFEIGLQGSVIVNAMTGEKQHIGYMGDMPAIASTFRNIKERGGTDIRIVAVLGTSKQQCNIFLVRNDAPEFADGREAVAWMDGKVTSAPHGACTDRFARLAFQKAGIEPKRYLNQNIEVITTNFRAGKLDAAAIWEPTASKIVMEGIARRAASGEDFDALDGGFMVMLNDLIEQRPDVHRGWLEAELDAQLYMLDPANADGRGLDGGGTDRADRQGRAQALPVRELAGEPGRRRGEGPARLHRHRTSAGAARRRHGVPVQPAEEAGCRRDDS